MRALLACLVLAAAAALGPSDATGQERRLEPLDEGAGDATWPSFRRELAAALERRDRDFVRRILHPEVRSGVQGRRGPQAFVEQWALTSDTSPLWDELGRILSMPAAWHRPAQGAPELCVPYVAVRWPQDVDAYRGGAIVVERAPVRRAPARDAEVALTLSHHLVEVIDWEIPDLFEPGRAWVRIRLKDGEGYVAEPDIRSPIEHAACFVRTGESWQLAGFGPGSGR